MKLLLFPQLLLINLRYLPEKIDFYKLIVVRILVLDYKIIWLLLDLYKNEAKSIVKSE